jgi:23S rRNA (cytidine1920-2'-O)/16S rRNA (cytidine1409-2'-O)-methyltransferase
MVRPGGWIVLLVKPQFEAARSEVSRGSGVVTDPDLWKSAIVSVIRSAQRRRASIIDVMRSPLKGGSGNVEFLLYLRAADEFARHQDTPGAEPDPDTLAMVDAAVSVQ